MSYSAVWDIIFHMVCWSTITVSRGKRCTISLEFPRLNIAVIKSGRMLSDNLLNKEFIREAFHRTNHNRNLRKLKENKFLKTKSCSIRIRNTVQEKFPYQPIPFKIIYRSSSKVDLTHTKHSLSLWWQVSATKHVTTMFIVSCRCFWAFFIHSLILANIDW